MQPMVASAAIGRRLEVGPRLSLKGSPDIEMLGEALHNIFAADLIDPNHAGRVAMATGVLESHGLSNKVAADDVLACASRFQGFLHETFKSLSIRPEWPVTMVMDNGQHMNGWIDVLVDTEEGWIIIDHKSFPGRKSEWEQKALSYSGQLEAYRRAVMQATKRPVISQWIHFSVGGGLVEIVI
jgi:ATP-dependent helicase/nuclease subunit A